MQFQKDEIVWAKVKGFSWWPGFINHVNLTKKEYNVSFFGENSYAVMQEAQIAKFESKFNEYSKTKSKKLLKSIQIAQKVMNKESTFGIERKKLLQELKNKKNDGLLNKRKNNEDDEEGDEEGDEENNQSENENSQNTQTNGKVKTDESSTQINNADKKTFSLKKKIKKDELSLSNALTSSSTSTTTNSAALTTSANDSNNTNGAQNNSTSNNANNNANVNSSADQQQIKTRSSFQKSQSATGNGGQIQQNSKQQQQSQQNPNSNKIQLKLVHISSNQSSMQTILNSITDSHLEILNKLNITLQQLLSILETSNNHSPRQLEIITLDVTEFCAQIQKNILDNISTGLVEAIVIKRFGKKIKQLLSALENKNMNVIDLLQIKQKLEEKIFELYYDEIQQTNSQLLQPSENQTMSKFKQEKINENPGKKKYNKKAIGVDSKNKQLYLNNFFSKYQEKKQHQLQKLQQHQTQSNDQQNKQQTEEIQQNQNSEYIQNNIKISPKKEQSTASSQNNNTININKNEIDLNINKNIQSQLENKQIQYQVATAEDIVDKQSNNESSSADLERELKTNNQQQQSFENINSDNKENNNFYENIQNRQQLISQQQQQINSNDSISKIDQLQQQQQQQQAQNSNNISNGGGCGGSGVMNHIENPNLRKKVCQKIAKILQEKYKYDKSKSQDLTLKLEYKIREINPDMKSNYKNKIFLILKLLKYAEFDTEKFIQQKEIDFEELKIQFESTLKQAENNGCQLNLQDNNADLLLV